MNVVGKEDAYMIDNLTEQLNRAKENLKMKQKWEIQLEDYRKERYQVEKNVEKLKEQLQSEIADVDRLEGVSFKNLIFTLSGKKLEKLEKEKEEVMSAQLHLQEARKTKAEIEHEMKQLENKLYKVVNADKVYQELLSRKERHIKMHHDVTAETLYRLSDQETDIESYLRELDEANEAGNHVINALNQAIKSLDGAEEWGVIDLFGGGMITDAIKYDYIETASEHIHHAQSCMRKFQKELLDIDEMAEFDIDISGLLKFADFFFDGLITDWLVQNRISDAQAEVERQLSNVKNIIENLQTQVTQKQNELRHVKDERNRFIENY